MDSVNSYERLDNEKETQKKNWTAIKTKSMDILSEDADVDKMQWYLGWSEDTWIHRVPRKITVSFNQVSSTYAMNIINYTCFKSWVSNPRFLLWTVKMSVYGPCAKCEDHCYKVTVVSNPKNVFSSKLF